MKVNNPRAYFAENKSDATLNESIRKRNQLMKRGDVQRKFAASDSTIEDDWHFHKAENDSWVKYSFDEGENWLLKLKFSNNLMVKVDSIISDNPVDSPIPPGSPEDPRLYSGYEYIFDFSDYSSETYNAIKNSKISFVAVSTEMQYFTTLPSFRYKFSADETQKLFVTFLEDLPSDSVKIQLIMSFDGDGSNALIFDTNLGWTEINNSTISNGVQI